MSIELAVVIPSYNERDNVKPMVEKLNAALAGIEWEAIYVDDDSKDGTYDVIREVAQVDSRIRCIHRVGRRGLSSAAIEGMMSTSAPYIAVIDADLQHDETILPKMLEAIKHDNLDIAVGSRYVEGGGTGNWDSTRKWMSDLATKLGQALIRCNLKDPMSGFFMVNRSFFMRVVRGLSGRGYKILLDLFATSREPVKFTEVAYEFRLRQAGESKISSKVLWDYGVMLLEKGLQRLMTKRFATFLTVGLSGLGINLVFFYVLKRYLFFPFESAQLIAIICAMTSNYTVNNLLTFSDRSRLGGKFFSGLIKFYFACSIGAVVNLWVSTSLNAVGVFDLIAVVCGALCGAVWNFISTSLFIWKRKKSSDVSDEKGE